MTPLRDNAARPAYAPLVWGLGLLGCVAGVCWLYLQVPPQFPQPPFWSPRPDHAATVAALYRAALHVPAVAVSQRAFHWLNLALLLAAFGCYTGALWCFRQRTLSRPVLIVTASIIAAACVMPPLHATDVFYYAVSGQIAAQYGANPYLQPPAAFPQSGLVPYNYWVEITTPYGPVWTLVASAVAGITRSDPFAATLGFKLLGAVSLVVSAVVIWRLLCALSPRHAAWGTLLFVWNPVIVFEMIGNAHNDALTTAFVMGAAVLLYQARYTLGWLALLGATLLKYLTAPLLALFLLARVRPQALPRSRRWWYGGGLILLALAVTTLLWLPYWAGVQTLASLTAEAGRGQSGLLATILFRAGEVLGMSVTRRRSIGFVVSLVALGGVAVWLLWRVVRLWRQGVGYSVADELQDWAYALLLILLSLPRSHPWKLLPALALFAVVHSRTRRGMIVAYVIAGVWFVYRAASW